MTDAATLATLLRALLDVLDWDNPRQWAHPIPANVIRGCMVEAGLMVCTDAGCELTDAGRRLSSREETEHVSQT